MRAKKMKKKSKTVEKSKMIQSMEDSKSISKDCKYCKITEVFADSPILTHLSHGKNCKSNIIENVKHISVVHEGEMTYECEICDDNFTQQSGLKVHMERIHENKTPKIECPICGAQLTKSDLTVHVCSIHEGRKLSKKHQTKINNLKSKMMHQFQVIKSEDLTQDGKNINPNIVVKQELSETANDTEEGLESDPDFISCSPKFEQTDHVNTDEIVLADPLIIHEKKQRHKEKKNGREGYYKCNTCDAGFTRKASVAKHIEDVHERKKPHQCSACGAAFSQRSKMVLHFESVHEGKKPYKCTQCDKTFAQKNQLSTHIIGVHEGKKPYLCDICRSTFKRKAQIKQHIDSVHEGKKPFNCNICKLSFSTKGNMKTHLKIVHDGIKPFECDVCQARFSINRDMKIHKDAVHHKIRAFQCNFCDQTCTQSSSLKTHIRRKHSDGKIIFPLPLDVHIEKSLNEGKIPCQYDLCGKSFASKQRLRSHVEAVHEGNKLLVDRLNCDLCDKSFVSKQRLNSHVASIHEFDIKVPESDIRQDLNEPKVIESKIERLKTHIENNMILPSTLKIDTAEHVSGIKEEVLKGYGKLNIGTQGSITKKDLKFKFQGGEDKSVTCKICNKMFAKMHNLKQHIETVHEENKFGCKICYATFLFEAKLKRHIIAVHEKQKKNQLVESKVKRKSIDVFLPFDGLRKTIALMAIKKRKEEIVRKTNCDEMRNKKIYFKRAKDMLCYEQSICMSKDAKYFIISFKAQIKALYKKMDKKIDETSEILNDFNMKTFFGETSRTIELAWNKMNDKVLRDWHKLGVKMDLAFKDVAKDQGISEDSIVLKFNSIDALV